MKRRSPLMTIVLLLAGGAIINVVVAWVTGAIFHDGSRTDCIFETQSAEASELANVAVCIAHTWAATRMDVFENFDRSGSFRNVPDLTNEVPHWLRRFTQLRELANDDYDHMPCSQVVGRCARCPDACASTLPWGRIRSMVTG